eukprot:1161213-Pelagomonas_calceolata.AAC.8
MGLLHEHPWPVPHFLHPSTPVPLLQVKRAPGRHEFPQAGDQPHVSTAHTGVVEGWCTKAQGPSTKAPACWAVRY